MTMLQRATAASVALAVTTLALVLIHRKIRFGEKRGLWVVLACYCLALLAAFLFGVIADDGLGWGFLPLLTITAPWSFLVAPPLSAVLNGWGLSRIGPLLMNFLLVVVICGGLNMLLLYFFITRVAYPPERPKIT